MRVKAKVWDNDLGCWLDVNSVDFEHNRVFAEIDGHMKVLSDKNICWYSEPEDGLIKIAPKIKMPEPINVGG